MLVNLAIDISNKRAKKPHLGLSNATIVNLIITSEELYSSINNYIDTIE